MLARWRCHGSGAGWRRGPHQVLGPAFIPKPMMQDVEVRWRGYVHTLSFTAPRRYVIHWSDPEGTAHHDITTLPAAAGEGACPMQRHDTVHHTDELLGPGEFMCLRTGNTQALQRPAGPFQGHVLRPNSRLVRPHSLQRSGGSHHPQPSLRDGAAALGWAVQCAFARDAKGAACRFVARDGECTRCHWHGRGAGLLDNRAPYVRGRECEREAARGDARCVMHCAPAMSMFRSLSHPFA
jgi:hypothetical protein